MKDWNGTTTVIYSVNKPNIKADKYLCLSTDMEKIIETNFNNSTNWITDCEDRNACEFMDKVLRYRIHPHSKWGIVVGDTSVATQSKIPYTYDFLEVTKC